MNERSHIDNIVGSGVRQLSAFIISIKTRPSS
jgi:hypothetical protein